jgi:hypothetical protein
MYDHLQQLLLIPQLTTIEINPQNKISIKINQQHTFRSLHPPPGLLSNQLIKPQLLRRPFPIYAPQPYLRR